MRERLQSVLVSHAANKSSGMNFGVSGMKLSQDWILTHGTLLSPNFFECAAPEISDFLYEVKDRFEKDLIAVPRKVAETTKFLLRYFEQHHDSQNSFSGPKQQVVVEKECTVRLVWRCAHLRKTFNDLLFSWSFEKVAKFDKSLLSIFLLLKVDTNNRAHKEDEAEGKRILSDFYARHLSSRSLNDQSKRGVTVEIESVPFGNVSFLDSVSQGIVSNVLGEANSLVLSDANSVPGCEGAPLYICESDGSRRLSGMVIAPLSWCRGEWVNYTFAANLRSCVGEILRLSDCGPAAAAELTRNRPPSISPELLDRSLVVVKCGSGWGTGVIVDVPTGTILTCAHVVREQVPGGRVKIEALGSDEARAWARLEYKTREGQPYDVAVLRLEHTRQDLRALALTNKLPPKGTSVITAGYPFFGSQASASWSQGVLSRLTECMLQTTCCVQSGASGGPVLEARTGRLLGLVVSNAVSAGDAGDADLLYPRFNMAVPANVILPPLRRYFDTADVKYLECLSSSDPRVQETWNFYLTPRSKM